MTMFTRPTSLVMALLICLGTLLIPTSAHAQATECFVYDIVIEGTASGNPFRRNGIFVFYPQTVTNVTENGVNPFEIWFSSGSPAISPELGSIIFTTNTFFAKGRTNREARIDLARLSIDRNNTITVAPDPPLSTLSVNYFNSSSGLLGSIYQIYDGGAQFQFRNNGSQLVGVVQFIGKGVYYYTDVHYNANISGNFREQTTACFIAAV